ncbi:MAG: transposase [Bryobacter sp.]|nr:transposase [Bryobacter sp. CoA8 C33]
MAETIAAELGSLLCFASPRQFMGYRGLAGSGQSCGGKVSWEPITRSGNAHSGRVEVKAG